MDENGSEVPRGFVELSPVPFPLLQFLNNLVENVRGYADKKNITLDFEWSAELPVRVVGDKHRLREILENLLMNAIKFTDEGGVTLRVKKLDTGYSILDTGGQHPTSNIQHPATRICFEVEDTGTGILPEEIDRVFLPFYQVVNKGQKRTEEGSGLGLAISRQLVRLMESELHVNSRVGRGTTFWFDLELPISDGLDLLLV